VASGQPIGILPPPNRAGHTFAGWWTATGNNAIRVDESRIITANITLFARWNITVTFNSNGGIAVPNRTLISGSTLGELPPTTRGDFVFGGWWNSPTGGTQINHNTVLNGNITLFARWHAIVSFNPNGCNVVNPSTRTVLVGTAIGNLPNTSRSGHTFAGWWTGQTGGTQVLRDTIINSGIALFARWNQNIIVTFDANGGTPATQQRTVQNGQSLGNQFPANPTRNGHTFGGWFIQPSLITQMLASTIITGNLNLSARWRFTITFNGNGGQTPNPLILTSGITVGELPRPTRDNHRFLGWATSQSNTNVLPDGLLIEGNATLWARWEVVATPLRVAISSGHGLHVRGAVGIIDEVDEARRVTDEVARRLRALNVNVVVFHDNTSTNQTQNVNTIVSWHNSQIRDVDISVHFNSFPDPNVGGTETLYRAGNVAMRTLAQRLSSSISQASGLEIRRKKELGGAYARDNVGFLNFTLINGINRAILLEICFVNNQRDVDLYRNNFNAICNAIATTIHREVSPVN